jgi:hypothetical protein
MKFIIEILFKYLLIQNTVYVHKYLIYTFNFINYRMHNSNSDMQRYLIKKVIYY